MKKILLILVITFTEFILLNNNGGVFSAFTTQTSAQTMTIKSGTWNHSSIPEATSDTTPTPTPEEFEPTPDPTPTSTPSGSPVNDEDKKVKPGDIILNEIMWMGTSSSSADEWIELRNMRSWDIDLSGWKIENIVENHGSFQIPDNYIIPGLSYFIIANYNQNNSHSNLNTPVNLSSTSLSLSNDYSKNGQIILKDKDGNVIDSTPLPTSSNWPAGDNTSGLHRSMERKNDPGDGSQLSSWGACNASICNSNEFWKTSGKDYGTPRSSNAFETDKASPSATLNLSSDHLKLAFQVSSISNSSHLDYQITYDTDTISDGIQGSADLTGQDTFSLDNLTLGTCSTGGTCVYYSGVKNIHLKVDLKDSSGQIVGLDKLIP
ncbi:MAG: lamin tail domain-containing protein [Patescibacteria group bacterium]|nr:lamin tail domain-containing protein [Patescibacteria group bacterium]